MAGLPEAAGSFSRSSTGASLRLRVLTAIVLALSVGVAAAGGASLLHARHSVAVELATAMKGARQTATAALARGLTPAQLTALFAHDRHVQAVVVGAEGGSVVSRAVERRAAGVPAWFVRLLDPVLAPARLPATGGVVLELRSDAVNEIGEVWTQAQDALLFLLVFSGVVVVLVTLTISRALRPLDDLSRAFVRLGEGGYDVRVAAPSAREVRQAAEGFNVMVARLATAQDRTARLERQLLELQDEERADIAHDLHDEIGPYLFAVSMDAETIVRLAKGLDAEAVVEPARAIAGSVEHIQHHVRDMLRRLKPDHAIELGLGHALRELVSFWSSRRPDIAFRLDLAHGEADLDHAQREAFYRVAQEAVSNAVRHADPTAIEIALRRTGEAEVALSVRDDGLGTSGASPGGLGLVGMRQRMAAVKGALQAGPQRDAGWLVTARAPATLSETRRAEVVT